MNDEDLNPCPCGGGKPMHFELSNSSSSFAVHTVFCPKCKKSIKSLSKGKAIEKWNRRSE